jgi:trans-aconitate methyltransferase
MEYKLFDVPKFHDKAFYATLGMADHINQPGHRERLLLTFFEVGKLIICEGVNHVADWGAGNGGLLHEIKRMFPQITSFGYDILPANVEHARNVLGVDVELHDIVNERCAMGRITIMSEVLEHLVDPHGMLRKLYDMGLADWVIASSPSAETLEHHWDYHLWIWTEQSYRDMFLDAGWRVTKFYEYGGTQFIVAARA